MWLGDEDRRIGLRESHEILCELLKKAWNRRIEVWDLGGGICIPLMEFRGEAVDFDDQKLRNCKELCLVSKSGEWKFNK